jgi:hypothetical protein
VTATKGIAQDAERSIARATFSPTTTPMLPPMNPKSITATPMANPLILPDPVSTASSSPLRRLASVRR